MPNTKPFRLRVLEALTAGLEQITVANGFHFDVSGKVFRGRDTFGNSDPLPMVSILESINEKDGLPAPRAGTSVKNTWELLIQGWTEDDDDNPTDPGQFLLADVKRRIVELSRQDDGYDILGMGGKIDQVRFSTGVVRPADEVSDKAYFWLKLELDMIENLLDPYA